MRVLVVLFIIMLAACSTQKESSIPSLKVTQSDVLYSLVAEGELEAVNSTPIIAGANSRRPQVLSWIADQYSIVKKDDVIARF